MKIGFDITTLSMPKTGIGQYQYNLIENLLKIDNENEYNLYAFNLRDNNKYKYIPFSRENKNVKLSAYKIPQRLITAWWMLFRWPRLEQITDKCDLYQISEICQQPTKSKTVAFIHDLTTIFYPEYHLFKNKILYHRRFQNIKKYADAVLTNSNHTKQDIQEHLKIDPDRIFVTYFGAHKRFRYIEDVNKIENVKKKYSIDCPYICYLGTIEPRKNISNLLKAFYELKITEKIPHKLLLIGKEGWFYEPIYKKINELNLGSEVIKTGFIDDDEIPYLLNGADIFAYPSFYEGFGLPVLEAMSCGTPVVTSRSSALSEVGGDAVKYCNPKSPESIAEKIYEFISSEDEREKYSTKGLKRAENFSWKKCAEETLAVYKKVAGK
jgi:glycosyltransferase involved in cell wall biosynthesis